MRIYETYRNKTEKGIKELINQGYKPMVDLDDSNDGGYDVNVALTKDGDFIECYGYCYIEEYEKANELYTKLKKKYNC